MENVSSSQGRATDAGATSVVSLLNPNQLIIASLLAAVVLVVVFVFFSKRRSKSRGNSLLLLGAPDAGKTAILSTLVHGESLSTLTSIQPNFSVITLADNKNVHVADIPGHPRIRDQFKEYISDASAVAFVVDASTISRNGAAVAEHLHNVLHEITSLPPSHQLPALVIVAHKIDLLNTSGASGSPFVVAITRVRTVLERELEKRRASQSGVGIEGLGEDGEKSTEMGGLETTGPAGGVFKFADWEGGEVGFVATSSKPKKEGSLGGESEKANQAGGVDALSHWIEEYM